MRGAFVAAIVAGLLVGGAVAGFRAFSGGSSSATPPPPSATAQPGSPKATADAFAAAWSSDNLNALYLLLDADSQRATPYNAFAAAYDQFSNEMTATSVQAHTASASDGAASLAVHLSTAYFGEFEYTTQLRLTRGASGWLVAWDNTAIHPEMTDGRRFKSEIKKPERGAILDRNGEPLALTRDVRMLALNRAVVTDRARLTAALIELGFTQEQIDTAFASPAGQNQRVPVGPVPDEKKEQAADIVGSISGALLYFEAQRIHPLGPAAAHAVGYTRELTAEELARRAGEGYRPGDRIGAVGIEASQESVLAGKIGAELRLVEADGSTTVKTLSSRPFVPGQDVTTTLDAATLRAAYARLGDRAGAAVVIDPQTNEVLALNSSPAYDPDAFERNDAAALNAITQAPDSPLANRATTGLYSAGSTFKLITGAAGLVYGGYQTTDTLYCGSIWTGIDPPRRNWEGAQGDLTIAEGLMRSCNPVFYQIGLTLYNETDGALSQMARQFGFGEPTGIVGIGEEDGLVPDAQWKKATSNEPWYPGDEVNLAIGQGALLITPLQLANAYSAFIHNGLRVPVLIEGQPATDRGALPLSDAQHNLLLQGLQLVASARGTASTVFALAGYTDFAGKSGTAEDAGSQQHVLFVAMSPASAPRAIAAVVLDEGDSGSIEAGPIARDIVLAAIQ